MAHLSFEGAEGARLGGKSFRIASVYSALSSALLKWHKTAEAVAAVEMMRQLTDDEWARVTVAVASAAAGDRTKAEAIIKELDEMAARQFVSPCCYVFIYAALGDKNQALDQLERAETDRDPYCLGFKCEPTFDEIHADPRFQAVLRKARFP